jgi:hypothetical protein
VSELKTKKTGVSVKEFVAAVENDTRRKDAENLVKLFQRVTGWKPKMWGPTIVGFGKVAYKYESGRTGEICVVGFSPRKANLVFYYGGCDLKSKAASNLFSKLGKHKLGDGGCLYINKLADIDQSALKDIIELGLVTQKKLAKDKKWSITSE